MLYFHDTSAVRSKLMESDMYLQPPPGAPQNSLNPKQGIVEVLEGTEMFNSERACGAWEAKRIPD